MTGQEPKLDRILHRHERILQKMLQEPVIEEKKHKYLLMEMNSSQIEEKILNFQKNLPAISNLITIKPFNYLDTHDQKLFIDLFNLVLLSSPDPWRPLSDEDAQHFHDGTFLAFMYGKCVGYGVLTIENTTNGKYGVIAGIGVHPKHRRKKIALILALEMAKWFLQQPDLVKLQCEVYESNNVSYQFITSFGFKKVDEFYLE